MGTSQINNILVSTKFRYIGDTLLAVPTLRAIRNHWPLAHVTLLTGTNAAELLRNCPYVDELIGFDPESPENRGLNLYRNLVPRFRKQRFDAAFVYHTSMHSALVPFLSGIPRRYGWAGFVGRDLFFTRAPPYIEDRDEIDSDLAMVRDLAPDLRADRRVELWLTPDELDQVPESLRSAGPIVGIQPGATNNGKRWPAAYYADLVQSLIDQDYANRIAVIGGRDESASTDEFFAACPERIRDRIIDLTGALPLRGTLAALKRLALFVGNDTAIRHTTVALDVPSIGLFGPTNSIKWGNCEPPRQQIIVAPTRVMADISARDVFELARAILNETAPVRTAAK